MANVSSTPLLKIIPVDNRPTTERPVRDFTRNVQVFGNNPFIVTTTQYNPDDCFACMYVLFSEERTQHLQRQIARLKLASVSFPEHTDFTRWAGALTCVSFIKRADSPDGCCDSRMLRVSLVYRRGNLDT